MEIAKALAKAGQTKRANLAFNLAIQVAQKIEDEWARSSAFREIAVASMIAGQIDIADQALEIAILVAQGIENARRRSLAFREIAKALAKAGQIDRAIEVAEMIEMPEERSQVLDVVMAAKREKER
jgi:serine protease Do